jgi:cytochrome c oxidase subunit 2
MSVTPGLWRVLSLGLALALSSGCDYRRGALDPVSPEALTIQILFWVFFWISLFVLTGVVVALLFAIHRGHSRGKSEGAHAELTPDAALERRTHRAVLAASLLSALTLVGLLVASVFGGRALFRAPRPTFHAKIIAHQWWWEVQYEGKTASESVSTPNELHLPAGSAVELELQSVDVIHSLWLPNLHGKRDLIPGHTSRLVLRPTRPGRYEGHCAEFCGLQHARMELPVTVEPPDTFSRWLTAQRRPALVPAAPDARRGAELFTRGPCALCHSVVGTEASGSAGPDLTHLANRPYLAAGALPNSPLNLRAWLRDPQTFKPGVQMPATGLREDQLDDLVAYLETLR